MRKTSSTVQNDCYEEMNDHLSSCSIEERREDLQNLNTFSLDGRNQNEPSNQFTGLVSLGSDRFLPTRKSFNSTKELYSQGLMWDKCENLSKNAQKKQTVSGLYKKEVLGDIDNYGEEDIRSYHNANILKYKIESSPHLDGRVDSFAKTLGTGEDRPNKNRRIAKTPIRTLQAPALSDDFYLNLIDWSSTNIVSVGLSNSVYLWNGDTAKASQLMQLDSNQKITCTSFSQTLNTLAIGTNYGEIEFWDYMKNKKITSSCAHTDRVSTIAWNNHNIVASGSRDKRILIHDFRMSQDVVQRLSAHKQEVCGLKWAQNQQQLASGGNDNRVYLWSMHTQQPTFCFNKHKAAIKALAWSPYQHGLLVSGGGTSDKTIRLWNSLTGEETRCLDVGSQVCNLMFAKESNQLISTHGYSQNEITIWEMPHMVKKETLEGHQYRVLYLAMSPDGSTIVTGAGDQTLRFWNVFPKKQGSTLQKSLLNYESVSLR